MVEALTEFVGRVKAGGQGSIRVAQLRFWLSALS
jgi:hypothetical protein